MTPTNVIPFPDIKHESHCGGCLVCGKNDGYINQGAEHWFICREHKMKWLVGENLFDNWMTQTVAQHLSAKKLLDSYQEITPLRLSNYKNKRALNLD